jgi:hypothetical protein
MKNSLVCVTFNGKKSTMFAIILRQLEKWEIYQNDEKWKLILLHKI